MIISGFMRLIPLTYAEYRRRRIDNFRVLLVLSITCVNFLTINLACRT